MPLKLLEIFTAAQAAKVINSTCHCQSSIHVYHILTIKFVFFLWSTVSINRKEWEMFSHFSDDSKKKE